MGSQSSGKPKGSLIKLDGTAIVNGKEEKTNFFDFLKMDLADYSDIVMTDKQAMSFKQSVMRFKYGTSAAIPLVCSGPRCINKFCPFHEEKNYPLARPCLIETRLIQMLTQSYIEDLGMDPESPTEMTLVNKLVECDIIDLRANYSLSGAVDEEAGTLLKTVISESDNGTHKEEVKLHPLLEAKDKAMKLKMEILKSLVATRQEKYKQAAATKTDTSSDASKMFSEFKEMVDKISETKDSIIDGDWSAGDF